ncbi:hypothetical protein CCM_08962 [Cordyceps militaris CM01]|uniref:Uncharacterized protein n=1 Tax=Cordyceps militaris (strain CM01) TaxID=983644 RepID=G3JSR9_CORMM|nr:uncharacterized protein CCM_08962 [Cordyceps militaris CM01]EGX88915.1 hypothetical protein CCM_08962 [Cordyceps militaris CM01]
MPCSAPGVSPANVTDADKLQYAAIERIQLKKLTQIAERLRKIQVPTIKKEKLGDLSIALGAQLGVDASPRSPSAVSDTFFLPCDWPLEALEYETWDDRWSWYAHRLRVDPAILLQVPETMSEWFRHCLRRLGRLVPDLWDHYSWPGAIREAIGLRVPCRHFCRPPSHRRRYYESYVQWVMFATVPSAMPHAACLVLDSGTLADDDDDDAILLSEAEAAVALIEFQLADGDYTNHHTKPALVATLLRNQTARLTQAHFDGKQNRLVLRQSRTLDLTGAEPSPDSWTLLRWIASQPVGETRYAVGDSDEEALWDDPAHLTPRISA